MPITYESAEQIIAHYNMFKSMPGENTKLFMGVELETVFKKAPQWGVPQIGLPQPPGPATNTPFANAVELDAAVVATAEWVRQRLNGHAILKPEHSNGFEIVTCPATLNYHRSVLWNGFFQEASEMLEGRPGCGLHVHFSRDAVTPEQLARIGFFYHEPCNYEFLTRMAGRIVDKEGQVYNKAIKKTFIDGQPEATIREIDNGGNRQHTSITANTPLGGYTSDASKLSKTLEVRIFQSVVNRNHVMASLEFVHAVVAYMEKCPNIEAEMTHQRFVQWFVETSQMVTYPYLYCNLMAKEYIIGSMEEGKSVLQRLFFRKKSA